MFVWNGPTCALRELLDRDRTARRRRRGRRRSCPSGTSEDQLGQRERDLLGGREAVLAVEDHRVRDVDRDRGRAGALVLDVEDLEVLGRERERRPGRGATAFATVRIAVEAGGVVAELVRARLGRASSEPVPARGIEWSPAPAFWSDEKISSSACAADLPLAGAGERERCPRRRGPTMPCCSSALRNASRSRSGSDDPAALQLLHPRRSASSTSPPRRETRSRKSFRSSSQDRSDWRRSSGSSP